MSDGIQIDQFMWRWQIHFRISTETLMESALHAVGARLDPEIIIVGFNDDPGARHAVCIEPETGPVRPEHLVGLDERAEKIYQEHPDSAMWHSDAGVAAVRERYLRGVTRGKAIAELIEESGAMPGRHLEFGSGGTVGNFHVYVGVAIDQAGWDALPHLEGEKIGSWVTPPGLVDRLVRLVLSEATAALQADEPNSGDIRRKGRDLVFEAADSFCQGCIWRAGSYDLGSAFESFNAISERPYEGRGIWPDPLRGSKSCNRSCCRASAGTSRSGQDARCSQNSWRRQTETSLCLHTRMGSMDLAALTPNWSLMSSKSRSPAMPNGN